MTDRKLIKLLKSESRDARNRGFAFLIKRDYPALEAYVCKNSGTEEDAKDVFQEALMALLKNVTQDSFKSRSALKSYLFSIGKNLWLQQIRKMKKDQETKFEIQAESQVSETTDWEARYSLLREKFAQLGEECKKILVQFYYEKKSMKTLMDIYQLSSEQAAKNKKSRCLKKLTLMVNVKESI